MSKIIARLVRQPSSPRPSIIIPEDVERESARVLAERTYLIGA